MDDLAKILKDTYLGQLTSTLATHKIAIFFLYLLTFILLGEHNTHSLLNTLLSFKVQSAFDFEDGPFSKATILHFLLAIGAVYITTFLYRNTKRIAFNRLEKSSDFDQYVEGLTENARNSMDRSKFINIYLVKDLKKEIKTRKAHIMQLHIYGELFLSGIFITLLSLTNFNFLDLIGFVFFLLAVLFIQHRTFHLYVSRLIPVIATEKAFLEEDFEFSQGFKNIDDTTTKVTEKSK